MRSRRGLARLLIPLVALALLAGACGDDADTHARATTDAPAEEGTEGPVEPQAAFPVTIEHIWGSATIEEAPERVVSLGLTDADVALALGVTPVALAGYSFLEEGLGPWAAPLAEGDYEVLASEPNIEQIASLRPDVILAVNAGFDEPVYEQLARIAPTVVRPAATNAYQVSRDEATRLISTALGQPERGEELIEQVNRRYEQVAEEHPEFAGSTGLAAIPLEGSYWAYSTRDTRGQMMDQLGFELPSAIADRVTEDEFSVELSPEQVALLDADVLVMLADTPDMRDVVQNDPVLQNVPVVRDDRMVLVDSGTRHAMTYNTVLSVPHALESLVPQLASVLERA